jgi:alpha,alpha-trehalose phosphorylase
MIKRRPVLPPQYVYPPDDWRIVEKRFYPRFMAQTETIFAAANGYLGMRGSFEEGTPAFQNGTFINGFYETWDIIYGEAAYGFAKTGQTMINVPDGKLVRLYVDDEPFFLPTATLLRYERVLDMKKGVLDREVVWQTPAGKQILIRSRRLVSLEYRHVAALSYEVTLLNARAPVVVSSEISGRQANQVSEGDPRQARGFGHRVLLPAERTTDGSRATFSHTTANSDMRIAAGIDHGVETELPFEVATSCDEDLGKVVFSFDAEPGQPFRLTKYVTYHTSRSAPTDELLERVGWSLDRAVEHGFEQLVSTQSEFMEAFWNRSDVRVEGGHPQLQQAIRWNLYQLAQASGRVEGAGIAAKGLTGQAYEGHYFWDTEMYVLPFLVYTHPRIARNLLKFRHGHLDKARKRAREVNQKGALFPWRTISGDEASAYYAAGTAQYHINADIMYALRKYTDITGDVDFLHETGSEMLVETARLWRDLGFFSDRQDGKFCIHGVTGPDEYNTVVDNNTFTNLMARENLRFASDVAGYLAKNEPEHFASLLDRTGLKREEVAEWRRAADRMYIPFDEKEGIHPQDDGFLDNKAWDLENTPPEKFPLLLHYHPLVIYRHRVIKQADIVLAMFLLRSEFSRDQMKRNFDYYDPLTTGDSSLSASIQSVVAAEVGYFDRALEYFTYAVLMDLADLGGNVRDGVHVASTGGTWMALVFGFGGLRDEGGCLRFDPKLPERWERLTFPLLVRGNELEVDVRRDSVTYHVKRGNGLIVEHQGTEIELSAGEPVTVENRSEGLTSG